MKTKPIPASAAAPAAAPGFYDFLFKVKTNKYLFAGGWLAALIIFFIYKSLFPLPDIFSDSNSYVLAAKDNREVFYRPFGYSRFLQLVHEFSDSHYFLVFIQYILLVGASFFCFFSVDYLLRFKNQSLKYGLFAFIAINPVLLVLSNQVASDSLFTALSVIFFTALLWVTRENSWWALLLQLITLYFAFHTRYNALYYPVIAVIAFLLVRGAHTYKIAGVLSSLLLIAFAYNNIKTKTNQETGSNSFAAFGGWQMANNALFLYKHIQVKQSDFEDPQLRLLDTFVKVFIDSLPAKDLQPIRERKLSQSAFIWNNQSPLKRFAHYYANANRVSYFHAWYQVADLFDEYGRQIIKDHPGAYFRYFLLNNCGFYFLPDREFMSLYNFSQAELPQSTVSWFGMSSPRLFTRAPAIQKGITNVYYYLHCLVVLFSLIMPVLYLLKKKRKHHLWSRSFTDLPLYWYLFFLANMVFSILAAIVTLRYEITWFILLIVPIWFLDQIRSSDKPVSHQ